MSLPFPSYAHDSMFLRLCIGTGRVPPSNRTAWDYDIIEQSSIRSVELARDSRLSLEGQAYSIAESGLRIRFTSKAEIETFYREAVRVFARLDKLSKDITPLAGA